MVLLSVPVTIDFGPDQQDQALAAWVRAAEQLHYQPERVVRINVSLAVVAVVVMDDGSACTLVLNKLHQDDKVVPLTPGIVPTHRLAARWTTPEEYKLATAKIERPDIHFLARSNNPEDLVAEWRANAMRAGIASSVNVIVPGAESGAVAFVFMKDGGVWALWLGSRREGGRRKLYVTMPQPEQIHAARQARAAGKLM